MKLSIRMATEEGYDKEGRVVTEGDIYFGQLAEFRDGLFSANVDA